MTMSVHDALQAWVDGEIATDEAARLSGAASVLDLFDLAVRCDVDMIKIQRVHDEADEEFVSRFLEFHRELARVLKETAK